MHACETNEFTEGGELEFALLALQKAADYNGLLHDLQRQLPEDELGVCKRLEAEHLVLRIVLVCCPGDELPNRP